MNGKRYGVLCLAILEEIERDTVSGPTSVVRPLDVLAEFEEEQILLHYRLLIEENFLIGGFDPKANSIRVSRMTWKGYDYLEELRRRKRDGIL